MGLILDSSVLIAVERGKFDLTEFFRARSTEAFFVAAITASELLHGVARADSDARREKRSRYVEWILVRIPVLDFDLAVARRHAVVWAALEKSGSLIGPHDLLIAATALVGGHRGATLNESEFDRVPGLVLEDIKSFAT